MHMSQEVYMPLEWIPFTIIEIIDYYVGKGNENHIKIIIIYMFDQR
jgi:hypothetical protein